MPAVGAQTREVLSQCPFWGIPVTSVPLGVPRVRAEGGRGTSLITQGDLRNRQGATTTPSPRQRV